MGILEKLQRIILLLDDRKLDARKFDESNNSAGVRLRVSSMEAIKALKELRQDVQDTKAKRK
jgi:predicted nucleotide-binding protein (sugar kinase/HSP70/actin superfamily)